MDNEWLNNLKPGDEVAFFDRFERVPLSAIVERVTPAQIVVKEMKFWKKDGVEVGRGSWRTACITQMTDGHRLEMKKRDLRRRLERIPNRVAAMTKDTVDRWMAFLDAEGNDQ